MLRILIVLTALIYSHSLFAENVRCMGKDPKSWIIPFQTIKQVVKHRNNAMDICLSCEGDSCSMKSWPEEQVKEFNVCKRLFTTPVYLRANTMSELPPKLKRIGKESRNSTYFYYNYSISKEGRVSDIKVTSIFGAGRLSKKEALQLWTIVTEDTFYEPIEIDGKRYEINNCKGVGWFPLRN
tara:strand:- start:123 stop:668 length:546 start_codon:yes stop_codon:yes gene_type:complete